MFEEVIFLQAFGFSGGSFGNVLSQWERLGVFSYALPFLLIFALIFGILQKVNIFGGAQGTSNKGINGVIAVSTALMALQFNFVPRFFSDIFPQLGVGLTVVLVGIILTGMFTTSNMTWIGFALGGVIFLTIMGNSFEFGSSTFWFWFQQNFAMILIVAIILIMVLGTMGLIPNPPFDNKGNSPYAKSLGFQGREN